MAKILIVDDEVGVRELLHKALSREGHEITTVPTADQALEHILLTPVDLIVIDVRLKETTGIDLLKKIRSAHAKTPVVIYSGALTPEIEKEARNSGACDVFNKSMDLPLLVASFNKIVCQKQGTVRPHAENRGKTVMIVDDEECVRRILQDFFNRKGYETIEAKNGEEAMEHLKLNDISIVLLDIMMPGMGGIETLKRLREAHPGLSVIMITGMQDDENVKQAIDLGAEGYILKPFDFLYLELAVISRLTRPSK